MREIPKEDVETIRKMQAVLLAVKEGRKVFFNVAIYENHLGLVYSTKIHKKSATGNDFVAWYKWHLTEKGKRALSVLV